MLYLVVLFLLIFVFLEIKKIYKEKNFKELLIASFFIVIAILYSIEIQFNTQFLPNPNRIFFLVKPVGDAFMKMLGIP